VQSMPEPEGTQPTTVTNQLAVPETTTKASPLPEQQPPPLKRSKQLCQPVHQLTYLMATKLAYVSQDCEEIGSTVPIRQPYRCHCLCSIQGPKHHVPAPGNEGARQEDQLIAARVDEMGPNSKERTSHSSSDPRCQKQLSSYLLYGRLRASAKSQTCNVYSSASQQRWIPADATIVHLCPTSMWGSVCLILTNAIIQNWHSIQIGLHLSPSEKGAIYGDPYRL